MNTEQVTKAILKELGDHLGKRMSVLKDVLLDWPDANEVLNYPTLSITTNTPTFLPLMPYQLSAEDPKANNKIRTLNVTGQYEWNLQLDFWTGTKPERHSIYSQFVAAFNSQYISGEREDVALALALKDYHGIFAIYDQTNYSFPDSEESSQRREWRLKVNVLANTKQVLERESFAILETEIVGKTDEELVNSPDPTDNEADISQTVVIPEELPNE